MRIAYDHQVFCDQPYGGISRYILEVAKRVHNPPSVEARLYSGLHLNRYLVEEPVPFDRGVYVKHRPKTLKARMHVNSAWTKAAMACWQPDVVHETYYHLTGWAPKRAKVVVTVHDMIHEIYTDIFPPDYPVLAWKRAALARADAVVCVSETTKSDLLKFFPKLDKPIAVIPHGHSYAEPSDASKSTVNTITGGTPFILFVGNRGWYKDFPTLLRAYAQSPTLKNKCMILSFGGGIFTADELGLMKELGLSPDRIKQFTGNDDLLHACYRLASVFVYPSGYEGFGIPLLEAYAAGCPIICSDTPVFSEVGQGFCNFFTVGNAEDLSAVLQRVMSQPENMPVGQPSPSYNWQSSAASHEQFYKILA